MHGVTAGQRLMVLRPKGVVLKEAAEMAATAGEIAEPPCVPSHLHSVHPFS